MKISLKHLILFVALLSVGLTLISGITAGYRVNQQTLIENTLETNRVYVQKIASTTDNFMKSTLQRLEYSAKDIPRYLEQGDSKALIANEVNRLFEQDNTFNSVIITSASGEIIAASPQSLQILGKQVASVGGRQALAERKPLITKPYMSITGRLIIFISQPIFDGDGNYLGFVGGSIYLMEKSILNDLLGEHFYKDGSYVYVVDEDGRILYHPNKERIGTIIHGNPVINDIMNGGSGAKRLVNSYEIDMLAGYAFMPTTKWGAVSQRPTEATLLPSKDLRNQMVLKTLPFLLLSYIIIFYISNRIARPLQQLAHYARSSAENETNTEIENVHAWYYEAIQLKNALFKSFSFFQDKVNFLIHESTTDPLTGLVNRRTMDEHTKKWTEDQTPYSIVLFDIDRFKRVNDTYGHASGDAVLKFVAEEMRRVSRNNDICCRYGGEEFILLLPETTKLEAFDVAERLRKKLETTASPCGEVVTISAGIASFPESGHYAMELIEIADKCLYEAKSTGRNKSIMAEVSGANVSIY
ncbi:sensor domain-containing diguanylate cyclase [Sporosarcina sp. E16_8]|uniref:sensor domain-containing diguanylate cyclase n=1 Tax=Sporosarcina sp. E16_8 TaxID=2789295 RepID=UPI001A90EEFE|nr:sensor domain-containing diguanylate cyclase [Sporosarcina sp. E16_8]MBO0587978.1 GGDEF domain-containing protein [Sporosarcina sp. E16_8]